MSTTPRTDEAIRKYRFLGSGPLELEGRFADFARELETELAAERAIVSRIWVQLGSPTYTDLKGRSIYDLIDEIKTDRAEAKQEAAHYMSVAQKATDELACEKENRNHLIEKGAKLETELAAAKAECERLRPHSLSSGEREDYHDALNELARLRAEIACRQEIVRANKKLDLKIRDSLRAENIVAHQMACAAGWERDQLRAELKELSQAYELNRVSIDELDADRARAERAEAALAEWSVLNLWGGTPEIIHEFIKGQQNRIHHCQDLETELAHLRAAIDAAMKGTT